MPLEGVSELMAFSSNIKIQTIKVYATEFKTNLFYSMYTDTLWIRVLYY